MTGHWILKTEPSTYSFADLSRAKSAVWDGVKNAVALKNLAKMGKGDRLLVYHTGDEKAIVGRATVVRAAYPDPKAGDPRLVVVDIAAEDALANPVTLAAIRAEPLFADLALVRMPRLSVVACSEAQYRRLVAMGEER